MSPEEKDQYDRSKKPLLGYCAFVGLVGVLLGLDIGQTAGFIAMPV